MLIPPSFTSKKTFKKAFCVEDGCKHKKMLPCASPFSEDLPNAYYLPFIFFFGELIKNPSSGGKKGDGKGEKKGFLRTIFNGYPGMMAGNCLKLSKNESPRAVFMHKMNE
ncbi:hypothetical protein CEXT_318401 [Caerostris extrusa]|uniref:Uncharacterized protein n=1 Tax=Caerostris extrusa TaxID=172846 RepID=A0AAV4MZN5_CAEEX|nr:hypothetical protein CEXT_318401 [Caerostris extrusa]